MDELRQKLPQGTKLMQLQGIVDQAKRALTREDLEKKDLQAQLRLELASGERQTFDEAQRAAILRSL